MAALIAFLYSTRAGIIARATAKEALRQPVFSLLLVVSLMMLVLNTFVPFFSLGDDVKMLEICGLATILISGMLLAIWTSSMSIAARTRSSRCSRRVCMAQREAPGSSSPGGRR